MQANREELVERAARAIARSAAKRGEKLDPGMSALLGGVDAYVDGMWPRYADDARAAIAELTQAPAEPSDALRSALELEPGFECEYDDSDNSFTILWPNGDYLVAWANGKIVRGNPSRPAEPVQREVTK